MGSEKVQKLIKSTDSRLFRIDKNIFEHSDIYFTHEYAQLYEEIEDGKAETVYFESTVGKVEYTYIKRRIPFKIDGKQFYDLTTAYGYGGPCVRDSTDTEKLIAQFSKAFTDYSKENNIVSEFIRFHLFENKDAQKYFDGEVSLIGSHIARDLRLPFTENFHKSIKPTVRRAERRGVEVVFDTTGECIQDFLSIYYQTMDRNAASQFYYFNEEFFQKLHQTLKGKIVYANGYVDGKIIGSFSLIYSGRYAYGFLGGSLKEYMKYSASTLLQYRLAEWAKEKGLEYFIIGGGYRGEDSLYKYKTKFDLKGDHPFYVGKKVHNEEIYQKLNILREADGNFDENSTFFPLYRL